MGLHKRKYMFGILKIYITEKIAKLRSKILVIKLSIALTFALYGLFGAKCFCPNCNTGVSKKSDFPKK